MTKTEIAARVVYYELNALIAHEPQVNSLIHNDARGWSNLLLTLF